MKKVFFALIIFLILFMTHNAYSAEETKENTDLTLHRHLLLHDDAEENIPGFCVPLSNLLTCNGSRYAQHTFRKVLKSALLCYIGHYVYFLYQKENGMCS
jgi:hypothetical protein